MAILRDNKNYACDMRSLFHGHTTYCRTKHYAQPYIPVQMRLLVQVGPLGAQRLLDDRQGLNDWLKAILTAKGEMLEDEWQHAPIVPHKLLPHDRLIPDTVVGVTSCSELITSAALLDYIADFDWDYGSCPLLVIYHSGIAWHPAGFSLIYLHTPA
jgi:hypothetical protein